PDLAPGRGGQERRSDRGARRRPHRGDRHPRPAAREGRALRRPLPDPARSRGARGARGPPQGGGVMSAGAAPAAPAAIRGGRRGPEAEEVLGKAYDLTLMKRLWRFVRPHMRLVVLALLLI